MQERGKERKPKGKQKEKRMGKRNERKEELTNQKNSGWTSVDRSTKATLSTYNTWIQLSRLQKIYRLQGLKLRLATATFNGKEWFVHNRAEA